MTVIGRDHVQLAPDRIMAPVGSEVVLRAGICDASGHLLANQRIEWLLSRDSAGEFVDLNDRMQLDVFRWAWDTPRKVDNGYVIGATAFYPICVDRGTPNPADDVQVRRGEAWVSVTSPTAGTSVVTAYAPLVDDWELRRATATIHWIDAQWVLPPSAVVESGRPHVLTTTVTRRTDGAPLAGWIVRYEAVGSGASLGYAGGNFLEVPTDAAGNASVEISPTDAGGGSSTINVVIVRPAQSLPTASPQLEVGRGATTLSWSGAASSPSYGAPQTAAPTQQPGSSQPPPSLPNTTPDSTYGQPSEAPSRGTPELAVAVRRTSAERVDVGDYARFEVVVTNRGDETARNISVLAKFDRGLSHPQALPNEYAVKYDRMRDLPPGESATVPLSFEVTAPGQQCHEVTVTADGAAAATGNGCITAVAPQPVTPPTLEVAKLGPTRQYVGETAKFRIVIRNSGSVPATGLQIDATYDAALEVRGPDPGSQRLDTGGLRWTIDRLEAGERREFNVDCACVAQARNACGRVRVTGDGGVNYAAEACLEILSVAPPPGAPGAQATTASDLRISVASRANPTRAGTSTVIVVILENTGQQTARDVSVRVLVPQEMTPNEAQIQPSGQFEIVGGHEIRFTPIAELGPNERRNFDIPVSVDRTGTVTVWAQVVAAGLAKPMDEQSGPIEILPRTP